MMSCRLPIDSCSCWSVKVDQLALSIDKDIIQWRQGKESIRDRRPHNGGKNKGVSAAQAKESMSDYVRSNGRKDIPKGSGHIFTAVIEKSVYPFLPFSSASAIWCGFPQELPSVDFDSASALRLSPVVANRLNTNLVAFEDEHGNPELMHLVRMI